MENVTKLFYRLIGPFILITGLSVFYFCNDQELATVNELKASYLDAGVYRQVYKEYETSGIESVTCNQLKSIVANGTDYLIVVYDVTRMRKFELEFEPSDIKVSEYQYSAANPDGTLLSVRYGVDNALRCIGSSGEYSVEPEYDLSNNVRRIVYRKI